VLFTYADAREMVGHSKDWADGLRASIMKFEQIVGGDPDTYDRDTRCGLCFVAYNWQESCSHCPADDICTSMALGRITPEEVLAMLQAIDLEEGW